MWGNGTIGATGQYAVPTGLSGVTAIAGNGGFTVALKSNGTVVAWGASSSGQTNVPAGLSGVTAISTIGGHTLALKSDGTVVAWGLQSGQANVPVGLNGVTAIAAGGGGLSVALKSDSTVVAWGDSNFGATTVPAGLSGVTAIAAALSHVVALKRDGTVVAWGNNFIGQTTIPASLSGVTAISTGYSHTLAIVGTAPAIGPTAPTIGTQPLTRTANAGQNVDLTVAATGTAPFSYQWRKEGAAIAGATSATLTLTNVQTNQAGSYSVVVTNATGSVISSAAVLTVNVVVAGTVVAWGAGRAGIIGGIEFGQSVVPAGLSGVVGIAAGASHTVALKDDGTVVAWGLNGFGVVTTIPAGLSGVTAIAAGFYHTVALKSNGTVVAWGSGSTGTPGSFDFGQSVVPAGLSGVIAIAAGDFHTLALKSDGTVVAWGRNNEGQTSIPVGLSRVTAIAGGGSHTVALKSDGTVVAWGRNTEGQTSVPAGLSGVTAIAAGSLHTVAVKSDGTVVAWGSNSLGETTVPAGLSGVTAIAAGNSDTVALKNNGTVVAWGNNVYGQTTVPAGLSGVTAIAARTHTVAIVVAPPSAPSIATQPVALSPTAGAATNLTVAASGTAPVSYQWRKDGATISGATSGTLTLNNVQSTNAGIYSAVLTSSAGSTTSDPAIVGVSTTSKVIGSGTEILSDQFVAFNNNTFDQVALQGAAATFTADAGQITRMSFVDLTDDIVQVEFSGAGTLSLVLDNPSGPATPVNYNQPNVTYMKGHAGIVITGANETTNVGVFSVGRITAVNQALFKDSVTYDGMADVAYIAIQSTNGKFGGLRTANASYFATKGLTGIYAPGVQFSGPVFVGDISASDAATPVLMIGSSPDTRITGGDLLQANGQPVKVKGITQLKFTAGSTSHVASSLPAQANKGRLHEDGVDVTTQTVVNP